MAAAGRPTTSPDFEAVAWRSSDTYPPFGDRWINDDNGGGVVDASAGGSGSGALQLVRPTVLPLPLLTRD